MKEKPEKKEEKDRGKKEGTREMWETMADFI